MRHVDVFLILLIHTKEWGMSKEQANELVAHILREEYRVPITVEEVDRLRKVPPPKKYLANRMHELGYLGKTIQRHLEVAQPTVSYYLAHPPKVEYYSPLLLEYIEYRRRMLQSL